MENEAETLQKSIENYETQLLQIQEAKGLAQNDQQRNNFISLENDIIELISLTRETLQNIINAQKNDSSSGLEDPFSQEYAIFKAELAELEGDATNKNSNNQETGETNQNDQSAKELQDDLVSLKGTKCQAPYSQHWQRADTSPGQGYHNALIVDVETSDNIQDLSHIQVRVLFVNPTEKGMLPCPYYLEGECRFSDDKCNFSHGELVAFSDIREYKEPDFSSLKEGFIVLAKQKDNLWHRARVKEIVDDNKLRVQFETKSRETIEVDLHDVLPLESGGSSKCGSDIDSSSESGDETEADVLPQEHFINMALTRTPPSTKLGEWEKHTKGIGSRLMVNMGYIVGCGLGKRGEGRLEPVEATAYPPGKSLDMCMALREAAGGDADMFKAEKRQRKQQQKLMRLQQRLKERETQRTDVFTFLNDKLAAGPTTAKPKASHQILASSSRKGLNVERFQLAENIKKKQKDILKLKQSLKRHESGSIAHKAITSKIQEAQLDLNVLQNNDKMIAREQNQRDDRKKMAVF